MHTFAVKGTMYSVSKGSTIPGFENWYNSTITEAFLNGILVLMKLIYIRDGSLDSSGNDASLYSHDDINLFISLICTDVWLSPAYCTFVCKINK